MVNYIKPHIVQQYILFRWITKYFTDANLFCELFGKSLLETSAHTPFIIIMI